MEVQKETKFLRLERMIVLLIMAELAVSLVHMPLLEYGQKLAAMFGIVVGA